MFIALRTGTLCLNVSKQDIICLLKLSWIKHTDFRKIYRYFIEYVDRKYLLCYPNNISGPRWMYIIVTSLNMSFTEFTSGAFP